MHVSALACDILDLFRRDHRRPGARMTIATLDHRLGTDPAVTVAVAELKDAGYLAAPDAETVELTTSGFDAVQRGDYRSSELSRMPDGNTH
jgi:hypothetical protein